MELVPIIYQILIISGSGFVLVLIISFVASKIIKNEREIDHKVVTRLPRVVSAQQYHRQRLGDETPAPRNLQGKGNYPRDERRPKEIRVVSKQNSIRTQTVYFTRETNRSKPRYMIVNKTMLTEGSGGNQTQAQYKIIYPIDYSQSA